MATTGQRGIGAPEEKVEAALDELRAVLAKRGSDTLVRLGKRFSIMDDDQSSGLSYSEARACMHANLPDAPSTTAWQAAAAVSAAASLPRCPGTQRCQLRVPSLSWPHQYRQQCRSPDPTRSGAYRATTDFTVQLQKGLQECGMTLSEASMMALFRTFDADCSGAVSYAEFLDGVRPPLSERRAALISEAFAAMDVNHDGALTVQARAEAAAPVRWPWI